MIGSLRYHPNFPSSFVDKRTIVVWLPPGYAQSRARYSVVYMHDGQNLFDPTTAYIGVDWGIDGALGELIQKGQVPPAMVVGIWNTPERIPEYMPQKPYARLSRTTQQALLEEHGKAAFSDAYLRFLVNELKPAIDTLYRTKHESCAIAGSSMGGLVSIYAVCEYPDVFRAVACLSTHWPAGQGVVVEYLQQSLPAPSNHAIYFDHGTETLDAQYSHYQLRVDDIMTMKGYRHGANWITRVFTGADHSERAWRKRVKIPLAFVLNHL